MTVVTISCFQCLIYVQQLLDLVLVFVKKLYVAGTHIYCSIFTAAEQQPPPPQRVNFVVLHAVIIKFQIKFQMLFLSIIISTEN